MIALRSLHFQIDNEDNEKHKLLLTETRKTYSLGINLQ